MSFLIIALPEAHYVGQPLEFMLLADGERVEAGQALAAELPQVPGRDHEVVALVPPRALSWHAATLPPGVQPQSARLRAVLEGLLEEQLLDAPADMHLALVGPATGAAAPSATDGPDATATHWVAACERRWLAMAEQGLEAAGCRVSRVLPEWGPPGVARLHLTGTSEAPELVLCHAAGVAVFGLDEAPLGWALGEAARGPAPVLSAEPALCALAQARLGRPVQPWPRSERWAAAALPRWDLARGLRKRRHSLRSPVQWLQAPRWQRTRWAALALVAVNLLGLNALAWSHALAHQRHQARMAQLLMQAGVQPQPGVAPVVQMQRQLDRLRAERGQPAPHDLAVMLGAVLPQLPPGQVPQALDYDRGQLQLHGLQLDPAAVRRLAEQLQPRGYALSADGASLRMRPAP